MRVFVSACVCVGGGGGRHKVGRGRHIAGRGGMI